MSTERNRSGLMMRRAVILATALAAAVPAAGADPAAVPRVERDQAVDLALNGFRPPVLRPLSGPVAPGWPPFKTEPKAGQKDFRPPAPPKPQPAPAPAPPPPPCTPNSPNWPNCLQPGP